MENTEFSENTEILQENQIIDNEDNEEVINIPRIDGKYVKREFLNVFGYDSGFFYSLRMFLTQPSQSLKTYLTTDRTKLTKPILFLFFTSFIFITLNNFLGWNEFNFTIEGSRIGNVVKDWLLTNYGYYILFLILFKAFWMRIFFRKSGLYFFEIAVILCYTMGFGMMISVVGMFLKFIFPSSWVHILFFILVNLYSFWAIGGIFGRKISVYLAYFFSYFLGILTLILGFVLMLWVETWL